MLIACIHNLYVFGVYVYVFGRVFSLWFVRLPVVSPIIASGLNWLDDLDNSLFLL